MALHWQTAEATVVDATSRWLQNQYQYRRSVVQKRFYRFSVANKSYLNQTDESRIKAASGKVDNGGALPSQTVVHFNAGNPEQSVVNPQQDVSNDSYVLVLSCAAELLLLFWGLSSLENPGLLIHTLFAEMRSGMPQRLRPHLRHQQHPSRDTSPMQAKLASAFTALDTDSDGELSKAEIDKAVLNRDLDPALAEAEAVLKGYYADICGLYGEPLLEATENMSGQDVDELGVYLTPPSPLRPADSQEDLAGDGFSAAVQVRIDTGGGAAVQADTSDDQRTKEQKLVASAHLMMRRTRAIQNHGHYQLYANAEDPIASITPEAIRQGRTGNCYFLAAVSALSACAPKTVIKMIAENSDGSYTVTFHGLPDEPICIDPPTVVELAVYARPTRNGIWPAVLEKAYGTYLRSTDFAPDAVAADNFHHNEPMSEVFRMLTGQTGKFYFLSTVSHDQLAQTLTSAFIDKRLIVVVAPNSTWSRNTQTTASCRPGMPTAIIGWDAETETVTMNNPWGKMPMDRELEERGHITYLHGGIFTMDMIHLFLNCDTLYLEDWRDDGQYVRTVKTSQSQTL